MTVNEQLRRELLRLASADQQVRRNGSADRDEVDRANLARLHSIVSEFGWPGRSLVGEDGADAAWLLLQHADAAEAIEFRRACLRRMEEALNVGEVDPRHVAYVSDRIAVFEGIHERGEPGLQRFGTQVGTYTRDNGATMEFPLDAKVEENRRAYLLPPRSAIDFNSRPYPIPYGEARTLKTWRWPRVLPQSRGARGG